MKKLILLLGGLLFILIVAVVIVFFSINGIAKSAIEKGGTYALGTKTSVSSVSVGVLSGKFSLSGLNVANPSGGSFKGDHFLSLGSGGVDVSLSTLRQPVIELPHFGLSTIDVNLEKRDGKTNYGVILDNVQKTLGGGGSADKSKPAKPTADETRFIIHDLDIQKVSVHADLVGGPEALGQLTRVTIPIERIKLKDVGKTGTGVGGTGVTMSELTSIIVRAVMNAAAENGGGLLPADMLNDLQGRLAALGDLGKVPTEVVANVRGKVEEAGKKTIDDVTKQGQKAIDDAADKLKGLIPGEKDKKKK